MQQDRISQWQQVAFDATAFSIFGLLFVAHPTTLVPSLLVVLAGVVALVHAGFRARCLALFTTGAYTWIARSMAAWLGVMLLLALIHAENDSFNFPDNELRMFLALTLLAMVRSPDADKWFLRGLALAGGAALCWGVYSWTLGSVARAQATTNHPIHFGNLSAIVLLLSATVALIAKDVGPKVRLLFVMAAVGGLVGVLAALSRSSFVVLLCLLPLGWVAREPAMRKKFQMVLLSAVVLGGVAVATSPQLRDKLRITEAQVDLQQIAQGNYMSSLGARAAMWKTAWLIFEEHPLLGVGSGHFERDIVHRIEVGEIPPTEIYNQPHSDILHALSSGGVLKLAAYLGILIAPFVFFFQQFQGVKNQPQRRLMPVLGMQVVAAYFLTGLTNSNFDLQIYSITYAVLVCVLASLCVVSTQASHPGREHQ
jgi:O-antigen ligase